MLARAFGKKWAERKLEHRDRLDGLWRRIKSESEVSDPVRLVSDLDRSIFKYVGDFKAALWTHPLVRARIATAEGLSDTAFFDRLGQAVSRKGCGFHRNLKLDRLTAVAKVLTSGGTWQEAYERVAQLAQDRNQDFAQPAEFRKQLKRLGFLI